MSGPKLPIRETIDPNTGSLSFPIHQTSAYLMPEGERYRYSRESNPTVEELARVIGILENAEAANVFASGMGAISTTLLALSKPGTRILIHRDSFARSYRMITDFLKNWGCEPIVPEMGNKAFLEKAGEADIVFLESLSNPILGVFDVDAIAEKVHANNGILIVDGTFATPINQKAIDHGADIAIQSLSKFISGHNDTIGGSAAGRKELIQKVDQFRRTLGTTMDPNTAYLTLRGIKTLHTRMGQINKSALEIAQKLSRDPRYLNIRYPGLPNHPDSQIARRMLHGFGGVVTFDLAKDVDPVRAMKSLEIVAPANTLGGANSTISHPSTMSHRSLTPEEKNVLGIGNKTYRLSVGLEEPEAILEDVSRMLD